VFIPIRVTEPINDGLIDVSDRSHIALIRSFAVFEEKLTTYLAREYSRAKVSEKCKSSDVAQLKIAIKKARSRGVLTSKGFDQGAWQHRISLRKTDARLKDKEIVGDLEGILSLPEFRDFPLGQIPIVSGLLSEPREDLWLHWHALQILSIRTRIHDLYFFKGPVQSNSDKGAWWLLSKLILSTSLREQREIKIYTGWPGKVISGDDKSTMENGLLPLQQIIPAGTKLMVFILPEHLARTHLHSRYIFFHPSEDEEVLLKLGTSVDVFDVGRQQKNDSWSLEFTDQVKPLLKKAFELEAKFEKSVEVSGHRIEFG